MKPVLFLPGFPATELKRRSDGVVLFPPPAGSIFGLLFDRGRRRQLLLQLTESEPGVTVAAGEPILEVPFLGDQAESLYDDLRLHFGYVTADNPLFQAVGWDWRLAIDDPGTTAEIARVLDLLGRSGRPVAIVHSTGGLVLRRFLERHPERAAEIEQVVAFGVPWAGNVKALHYLHRGEANLLFSAGDVRQLMRGAQAAYDLLPPDPAKSPPTHPPLVALAGSGRQIAVSPLVERSWMPGGEDGAVMSGRAASADRRLGARGREIVLPGGVEPPPITNLVGWGVPTQSWAEIDAAGEVTVHRDGEGDGTSAAASAGWIAGSRVRTFFLPLGIDAGRGIPLRHAQIWDAPPVIDLLRQALRDAPRRPFVWAAAEGLDERRRAVRTLRASAQDGDGAPLPNARLTFRPPLGHLGSVAFAGRPRIDLDLPTAGLRSNLPAQRLRFVVEIDWGGGGPQERRELPLAMHL